MHVLSEETPASPVVIVPAGPEFIPLCVPWSLAVTFTQLQQQPSQSTPSSRKMDATSTPHAPPPNGRICHRRIDFDATDEDADDEFEEAIDVIMKIAELLLRTADVLIQNR